MRAALDYYPTPAWPVHRLLERVPLAFDKVFDPCAGDGAIFRAVRSLRAVPCAIGFDLNVAVVSELAQHVDHAYCLDALEAFAPANCVLITNPPFKIAEALVRRYVPQVDRSFWLLRLGFLAAAKRSDFLRQHTPNLYVLPNRPSFGPNKHGKPGVDNSDYAWLEFPGEGQYDILDWTSKDDRA